MPPAPQQGNQDQHASGLLWIVAAIFAIAGMIWFTLRQYIVLIYISIKLYEVDLLNFFNVHLHISPYYFDALRGTLMYAKENPGSVTFHDMVAMGNAAGLWLRVPLAIILFVLTCLLYFTNATRVYKKQYTMKELAQDEQNNWPQIKPVLNVDLLKTDIDKGPWAMAMTPLQFCKKNGLLIEVKPNKQERRYRDRGRVDVILKRGEANKVFALQLGALWQGAAKLPPHARALFAVFAARINADTPPAMALLRQLSETAMTKLDITGTDALLKKHVNTKQVQKIVQSHAYVLTAMASMLEGAREDGVQASADFLWLKLVDRRLWYMLNTVGRQTPFIEVGGVFAHWIAEKELGMPLFMPMIEEATNAVELALRDVVFKPDEEAETSATT